MQYTALVQMYLSNGYMVNVPSMSGTQGEVAKVDLKPMNGGSEVIRVIMDRESRRIGDCKYAQCYFIRVLRFAKGGRDRYDTLWNNKGEVLMETATFEYGTYYGGFAEVRLMSEEEYLSAYHLHLDRLAMRADKESKPLSVSVDKLYRIVKGKQGYKTVRKADILGVEKQGNGYAIKVKGKADYVVKAS